ncbi:something about silencing, SAS, complex subunit 4 [Ceratobasidium sp. AG-Ba]|nr:something about silencing, SAS, complex subunit 4 [Ceratobasidium sp. AG-Ba]
MAPGIGEEQRPPHNVMIFDDPNAQHLSLTAAPAYSLYSQEPVQPTQPAQSPRFTQAPTPPSPSFKALGKRRASSIDPPNTSSEYLQNTIEPNHAPAPPYTAPTPASSAPDHASRPKPKPKPKTTKAPVTRTRVMPSRVRRGTTYGIGSNPIDAMIIEAQQRALETVPIVDPDAVFVITTDPKGPPVAGPSTSSAVHEGKEDERYFEREEVAENMRQQAIIQTPEFCLLSDVYQPSSRLRTRTEAEVFDSSDAAYERRHRKPEMMEKRQRRREKDKLEHERYKLKERVEQLRTMDLHHFRALLPPGTGSVSDSGPELEHVRSELLAHADDLIRRYDVLLPPDPRAANGQRLRLKEWEIRREGNRFIPLTDEAASELAAAGLLDEQSAAEAAAAGILITAAGPGLPLLGGKGAEGYGSGFRPNLVPSDEEEEVEVEGETTVEGEVEVEHEEQTVHEDEEPQEQVIAQPVAEDARSRAAPSIDDVPPRPSSGALKIKLKLTRPSARSSDLSASQDNTRAPSEQGSVGTQNEIQPTVDPAPPVDPVSPPAVTGTTSWAPRGPPGSPRKSDEVPVYPSPAPSTVPLATSLSTTNNGVWTELPYHDVPYEHQSREVPPAQPTPALPAVSVSAPALRMKTPRASTPTPVAVPALLAAAEREANQAAGRRGRNLRTAEAFGVKLPRAFEEEREFKIPEEWVGQCKMAVDEQDSGGNAS